MSVRPGPGSVLLSGDEAWLLLPVFDVFERAMRANGVPVAVERAVVIAGLRTAAAEWVAAAAGSGIGTAEPVGEGSPVMVVPDGTRVSTREAAEMLGISDSRVRRMCRLEELPATQVGRAWVIDRGDLAVEVQRRRRGVAS